MVYRPAHVAAVAVCCLAAVGALVWILWAALVFEGGIFPKTGAALQILMGGKTPRDFGYAGSPYQMGIFEGWIVNAAGALLAAALTVVIGRLVQTGANYGTDGSGKKDERF